MSECELGRGWNKKHWKKWHTPKKGEARGEEICLIYVVYRLAANELWRCNKVKLYTVWPYDDRPLKSRRCSAATGNARPMLTCETINSKRVNLPAGGAVVYQASSKMLYCRLLIAPELWARWQANEMISRFKSLSYKHWYLFRWRCNGNKWYFTNWISF